MDGEFFLGGLHRWGEWVGEIVGELVAGLIVANTRSEV